MQQALAQISSLSSSGALGIVAIALLGLVALLFALLLASRAQERRHLREIARAAEEMRSGDLSRKADVPPGSPVGFVAAAVQRLAEDLASRIRDSHGAEERLAALL